MDNVDEAQELISSIRKARGIDETGRLDENGIDLENSIRLLSEELYSTPAHFILELVQNADDNKYPGDVAPELTIVYRTDGYLWVGCNEIGFTANNVRSICRIGRSTKKVEGAQKGYIGEKGIGFKSVFKVADEVWISSGALSFKFDKKKPLGIIAPEWCDDFPTNEHVSETTVFCFQVPEIGNRDTVEKGIVDLKPELLLFLRQLRGIKAKIYDEAGPIKKSFSLTRNDKDFPGARITCLSRQHQSQPPEIEDFLVCECTCRGMPHEKKREGVTESNVLIAFPITRAVEPKLQKCHTFNFLPIRIYGLPFLLQGDFVLSANREDVLPDNAWNKAIIMGAMELFVQSVKLFNDHRSMKYTWPKYLTLQSNAHGTAFHGFLDDLVKRLHKERIVESHKGTMEPPANLRIVPQIFTDGVSPPTPLLEGQHGMRAFAAASYAATDLNKLKIGALSAREFFTLLRSYITRKHNNFCERPSAWHSRLSKAIVFSGSSEVRDLKLIPLRGGKWISTKGPLLYFPDLDSGLTLPGGIEIDIIDDTAAREPSRHALFSQLGAKKLNSAEVYKIILDHHQQNGDTFHKWTVEDVVSHAWFLFKSPIRPAACDLRQLRLASQNGHRLRLGSDLYMDAPDGEFRVSDYFGSQSTILHFLHDQYLVCAPTDQSKSWLEWLQDCVGIRTIPKLQDGNTITKEFQWIIDSKPSQEWLLLLRDQWSHYSADLGHGSEVRTVLAKAKVRCTDEQLRQLDEVYLPNRAVLGEPLAQDVVPMLAMKDPNDAQWSRLQTLGLKTSPNLNYYLTILRAMKSAEAGLLTIADLVRVYTGIHHHHSRDEVLGVRDAFTKEDLIFIVSPKRNRWVNIAECRWSVRTGMKSFIALNGRYPTLKDFFVRKVGVKNITLEDVVAEIWSFSGRVDRVQSTKKLLMVLNSFVGLKTEGDEIIKTLMAPEAKIFPMKGDGGNFRSSTDPTWFIADRGFLGECFNDAVALLDFDVAGVEDFSPLLKLFGMQQRMLSAKYSEETETVGESVFHAAFTHLLRSKASFAARLVDPSRFEAVMHQFTTLQVWCSTALTLRRYVIVNGARMYGKDDAGWIVVEDNAGAIVVHISQDAMSENHLPRSDLAKKLMALLDLPKDRELLLTIVLMVDSAAEIEHQLQEANIAAGELGSRQEHDNELAGEDALDVEVDAADESEEPLGSHDTPSSSTSSSTLAAASASNVNSRRTSPSTRSSAMRQSTASWTSSRRSNANRKPKWSVISESSILAAANASHASNIDVVASSSTQSSAANGNHGRGNPGPNTLISVTNTSGGSVAHEPASTGKWDSFDMSGMHSTLDASTSAAMVATSSRGNPSHSVGAVFQEQSNDFQDEIGRGGEYFIYNLFKNKFNAEGDCWTSGLRSHFGLSPFNGDEAVMSDFTIDEPSTSKQVTEWLISNGHEAATELQGRQVTYHLEVKTTSGSRDEPFSMSNKQIDMARAWHASSSDVYIVLRVYKLLSSPQFCAYVDPWELMQTGKLSFTPQGGYYVQPT